MVTERTWFVIALVAALLYLGWSLGLSTARKLPTMFADPPAAMQSAPLRPSVS